MRIDPWRAVRSRKYERVSPGTGRRRRRRGKPSDGKSTSSQAIEDAAGAGVTPYLNNRASGRRLGERTRVVSRTSAGRTVEETAPPSQPFAVSLSPSTSPTAVVVTASRTWSAERVGERKSGREVGRAFLRKPSRTQPFIGHQLCSVSP